MPFPTDPQFIGREVELERLRNRMLGGAGRLRRIALVGMGGIGKTQLAVEYARRNRKEYPGGVYWVNAAAPLVAELTTLADTLDLRDEAASEAGRPGRRLRAFEQYLHDNPNALVIFDNLAHPLALREPTAGVVLSELPCHLLFTTLRLDTDAFFETISIGALPEEAALRLLLASKARRALLDGDRKDELQAARAICGELGHLPLALVLASAYLGKSLGRSPTLVEYLQRLHREGRLTTADAAKVHPSRLATKHDAAVRATLRNQWDALETEDARHTLQVAALLRSSAHVSRATLARLTGLSNEAKDGYLAPLEEALNELLELSLIEEVTEEAIRLHPLVREFAASQIEDREAFATTCAKRLGKVLGDIGQIEQEVRTRGLDAVLADLRLGEDLGGAGEGERFRRLLRPLDLEAHHLRHWNHKREPAFFLQQARNISFDLGLQEVQKQAEAALAAQRLPYLRERLRTSQESEALVRTLVGHTAAVWGVALMPDGRTALSASHDGTVKMWELASGCELRTLPGYASPINSVTVSPDGQFVVSAFENGLIIVWDSASGRVVHTLLGHASSVNCVAVTPDSQFVVSASTDTTVKVWDLKSGRLVHTLEGHTLPVNSVVVIPGGSRIISASEDATLKVWDVASGQEVFTLAGHTDSVMGVAVTPDGRFAVSASTDNTLKVWDVASGLEVRTLEGHKDWVTGVAVTPDGARAISASADKTLKEWDLASGRELKTLEGHTEPVKEVTVTPDGRFAVSASIDNTLKVWDLASGREARTHGGRPHDVPRITITSDRHFAVSTSTGATLKVPQFSLHEYVPSREAQASPATWVSLTPDGRLAVTTLKDKLPEGWDLEGDRDVFAPAGDTNTVSGVAIPPDGAFGISLSEDTTLCVCELATGRIVATLKARSRLLSCAVAPDGCTFLAVDGAGSLHILDWVRPSVDVHSPRNPQVAAGSRSQLSASPTRGSTQYSPQKPVFGGAQGSVASSSEPSLSSASIRFASPIRNAHNSRAPVSLPLPGTTAGRAQPPTTPAVTALHLEVRTRLRELLVSDSDLDAFCIDFFKNEVYDRFTNGMDRIQKLNILLLTISNEEIIDALRQLYPDRFP